MQNIYNVGDIWMWTKNSAEHPTDPEYNYFLILDDEWGHKVLYLKGGRFAHYATGNLEYNKKYLKFIA
jgi:hypothetical protein